MPPHGMSRQSPWSSTSGTTWLTWGHPRPMRDSGRSVAGSGPPHISVPMRASRHELAHLAALRLRDPSRTGAAAWRRSGRTPRARCRGPMSSSVFDLPGVDLGALRDQAEDGVTRLVGRRRRRSPRCCASGGPRRPARLGRRDGSASTADRAPRRHSGRQDGDDADGDADARLATPIWVARARSRARASASATCFGLARAGRS